MWHSEKCMSLCVFVCLAISCPSLFLSPLLFQLTTLSSSCLLLILSCSTAPGSMNICMTLFFIVSLCLFVFCCPNPPCVFTRPEDVCVSCCYSNSLHQSRQHEIKKISPYLSFNILSLLSKTNDKDNIDL